MTGPLLVFAGAGSGKTRVITYRIANLVARERVAPWRILAVTFTNKAAGEMRNRLERPDMLGPVARDLWVGTFHATCAKFLRLFPEAIERTKSFVIYDTHRPEGRGDAGPPRPRPRRPPVPPEAGPRAHPQGEAGGARAPPT